MSIFFDFQSNKYVEDTTGEVVSGEPGVLNKKIIYKLDTILHFGKFKGKSVSQILHDVDNKGYKYIYWMFDEKFLFDNEVTKESNKFTKERMKQQGCVPVGNPDPETYEIPFIRKESLEKFEKAMDNFKENGVPVMIIDSLGSGMGFAEKGMLNNLKQRLDNKHADYAFDDEDISLGDCLD